MTKIAVHLLEFVEGGNTIWIHNSKGTVVRIQCTGEIKIHNGCENNVAHCDVRVVGDLHFCIPKNKK
jgi:hypothetical protein